MKSSRLLPLLVFWVVAFAVSAADAGVFGRPVLLRAGIGGSTGLDDSRGGTTGLGIQVAALAPVRSHWFCGTALNHNRYAAGHGTFLSGKDEYETTSLAALLGFRTGGRRSAFYIMASLGIAHVHHRAFTGELQDSPLEITLRLDAETRGMAEIGQLGIGMEFGRGSALPAFIALDVYQVGTNPAHTAGALIFGVAKRL